jgi:hypothetical protein
MSGPYPRSWDAGTQADALDADEAICRVWDVLDSDLTFDRVEEAVNPLLDALEDAGYVEQWGHSDTGCFWAITAAGHERLRTLAPDSQPN